MCVYHHLFLKSIHSPQLLLNVLNVSSILDIVSEIIERKVSMPVSAKSVHQIVYFKENHFFLWHSGEREKDFNSQLNCFFCMDQSSNVSACLFIDSILYIQWPLKFFPCFRASLKIPHEQGRSNCANSLANLYSLNKRCLRILFCFVCFVFKGRVKH